MIRASVFSSLDAPPQRVLVQEVTRAKLLPRCCGTYAFHDRAGDLLYIGKAKNVRTRVLSHLRQPDARYLLPPWTRMIADIEMRPAFSEMEALLVEADLIGRLRPPFNRQMRSWPRYCYLVRTDDAITPLTISTQLPFWRECFGPFRSRKQAVAIIEQVFRLASHRNGTTTSLDRLYAVLAGRDNSVVVELEKQCEALADNNPADRWARALPQVTDTLRNAFTRASLLRDAEQILGGIIVLPGMDDQRTCAVISDKGLHLSIVEPDNQSVAAFLDRYRERMVATSCQEDRRVPKSVSDCLCVTTRQVQRHSGKCRLIQREQACKLSASGLMNIVYGNQSS